MYNYVALTSSETTLLATIDVHNYSYNIIIIKGELDCLIANCSETCIKRPHVGPIKVASYTGGLCIKV